jgi:hypothetical protein
MGASQPPAARPKRKLAAVGRWRQFSAFWWLCQAGDSKTMRPFIVGACNSSALSIRQHRKPEANMHTSGPLVEENPLPIT